jgi:hypothetical protein
VRVRHAERRDRARISIDGFTLIATLVVAGAAVLGTETL